MGIKKTRHTGEGGLKTKKTYKKQMSGERKKERKKRKVRRILPGAFLGRRELLWYQWDRLKLHTHSCALVLDHTHTYCNV